MFYSYHDGITAKKTLPKQFNFHCIHIHCLVSINFQQASTRVNKGQIFHREEISNTPLTHSHFHIRHHFAPLLPPATQQQNITDNCWEVSASPAIPPKSTSNTAGHLNNIEGITFRGVLVDMNIYIYTCVYIYTHKHPDICFSTL